MAEPISLEVQGHRGARGLKPENTLPSFEVAFDLGVSAIETDIHLTRDGMPVLTHDPHVAPDVCSAAPTPPPLVAMLTLVELRRFRIDRNPQPDRFPTQDNAVTPLARLYAEQHGIDPFGIPTLADLFAFVKAYAGPMGQAAGKGLPSERHIERVGFDLELKRVPFQPELIGDTFDGNAPGLLESRVIEEASRAGVLQRIAVRSFDHRSVRAIRQLHPALRTGVLVPLVAPLQPEQLALAAGAVAYLPEYPFVDEATVQLVRQAGLRIVPWTVNEAAAWERLLGWGVDGITTDYPDRLLMWMHARGIAVRAAF